MYYQVSNMSELEERGPFTITPQVPKGEQPANMFVHVDQAGHLALRPGWQCEERNRQEASSEIDIGLEAKIRI